MEAGLHQLIEAGLHPLSESESELDLRDEPGKTPINGGLGALESCQSLGGAARFIVLRHVLSVTQSRSDGDS
jgi:hypothetical protein